MLGIVNKNFSGLQPVQPSHNALAVFNVEDAKIAFNYGNVHFVVVLNEKTGMFRFCNNIMEVYEFLEIDEGDNII